MPRTISALVWAVPAICGCVEQPIVSAWSDQCLHPWGRRRPFIFVGALGTTLSIMLLSWASTFGRPLAALFAKSSDLEYLKTVTTCVAILGLVALSISVQPLQCALRALLPDVCPQSQQAHAQSWTARLSSIGQVVGCSAGVLYRTGSDSSGTILTFRLMSLVAAVAVDITARGPCITIEPSIPRPSPGMHRPASDMGLRS